MLRISSEQRVGAFLAPVRWGDGNILSSRRAVGTCPASPTDELTPRPARRTTRLGPELGEPDQVGHSLLEAGLRRSRVPGFKGEGDLRDGCLGVTTEQLEQELAPLRAD